MKLKGIPSILSPDLFHALHSMGHGDEIVLADVHFPTSSICRYGPKEIRADGHSIPDLLSAILRFMPLDTYVYAPIKLMELAPVDRNKFQKPEAPIWAVYSKIIADAENRNVPVQEIERFDFYEHAKKTFAVVHTGETSQYGNIILRKGVVLQTE